MSDQGRRQDQLRIVRTRAEIEADKRKSRASLERIAAGTGPAAHLAADTLATIRRHEARDVP